MDSLLSVLSHVDDIIDVHLLPYETSLECVLKYVLSKVRIERVYIIKNHRINCLCTGYITYVYEVFTETTLLLIANLLSMTDAVSLRYSNIWHPLVGFYFFCFIGQ